jgi:diguanylate cyclase (GGDEF)-like protein
MKESRDRPLVLLVDPDLAFCRVVAMAFASQGYAVEIVSTFDEAIQAIHDNELNGIVVFAKIGEGFTTLLTYVKNQIPDRVVVYGWKTEDQAVPNQPAISKSKEDVALHLGAYAVFDKKTDPVSRLVRYGKRGEQHLVLLYELSGVDKLTGLDNYKTFKRIVEAELKVLDGLSQLDERINPPRAEVLSLLIIDVDSLHGINKDHGYLAADEALKMIGFTIKTHVRPHDYPCRKSGDEFLVLLTDTDKEAASRVGVKLQQEVAKLLVEGKRGDPLTLSISFGVGEIRRGEVGEDLDPAFKLLFERANIDLTEAKAVRGIPAGRR